MSEKALPTDCLPRSSLSSRSGRNGVTLWISGDKRRNRLRPCWRNHLASVPVCLNPRTSAERPTLARAGRPAESSTMNDDEDYEQDFLAAQTFLIGYVSVDNRGILHNIYCAKGSLQYEFCRAALIRLLRDERPLDAGIRDTLADMFEAKPNTECMVDWARLEIRRRVSHRPPDGADAQIARFVLHKVRREGLNVDAAVVEAVNKFEVSREWVYRAWGRFKPLFERRGPLPKGRARRTVK